MSKVNEKNYVSVQGWMVSELGLKGNELLVYALIYGFSQAEGQRFTGSLQYLADWTNSTRQGVQKNLKSLLEKGLIEKETTNVLGVNIVAYCTTELHRGCTTELHGGVQLSCTNNIDIYSNKDNIGKFHKPTLDEVKAYCLERKNNVNAERFVNYYESNGWKVGKNPMKDWRACIRTWEKNQFNTGRKNQSVPDYMTDNYETDNAPASLDETRKILERMKNE